VTEEPQYPPLFPDLFPNSRLILSAVFPLKWRRFRPHML